MSDMDAALPDILAHSPVRVVFGPGRLADLGMLAREEGAQRTLVVSDSGV
ncbi:MAG: alcohol dehydrogenase, partial [Planctomycetes bacterium]|nr:alcohol dehydrogenase [Planctomycetota bacterium]